MVRHVSAMDDVHSIAPFHISEEVRLKYADCFVYDETPALEVISSAPYAAARMLSEEDLLSKNFKHLIRNRKVDPLEDNMVWSHLNLASAFARDLSRLDLLSHERRSFGHNDALQTCIGPSRIAGRNQWNRPGAVF